MSDQHISQGNPQGNSLGAPLEVRRVETTTGERASADSRAVGRRRSDRIVAANAASQDAVDQASTLARSDAPVLITGPSGSGRRHFARAIHPWSARAGGPLVELQIAGSGEAAQQRDLFGDGSAGQPGALARADGGTLLLENLDQLAAGLLQRLGESLRASGARTRVIATALRDVTPFGGQRIQLKGLADRREDILPLAAHFLAEFAVEESIEAIGFSGEARRLLLEEEWPGNVRELRERIRQAIRLSGQGAVSAEALMLATDFDEVPSFKDAKRAFETRYVQVLLRRCGGNISRAARMAKKDRKDFYDVIRRTGIDPGLFRG